ncbi:glycosyltransferase family 4 protein [Haloarcula sp. JP-L23]|uniref:glycosyltransferase family 4 protein n=1 Tax=Haloarcula sp. JP-L23 TaxID=2716717 RepID=UPI00140F1CBC|nr:glycosyltransferase family 4 protein [Haloarcula sp. JP-L23]
MQSSTRHEMHVCFLFHREFLQDCSTSMNEYPQKLAELGVETTVVAARNSREEPKREQINGVDVHRIHSDTSTALSTQPTRFGYRAMQTVDRLCATQDIDILHMSPFPVLGGVLAPPPWLESPSVTVIDVRHPAVRNRFFAAVARAGIRLQRHLVDGTIVIDPHVAESLFSYTDGIDILQLGTDMTAFTPGENPELRARWGVADDDVVVGYTGSINAPRNLQRLVDAFARVQDRHPRTKLVFVGDGNDRRRLEQHVAELGLAEAVHFTGMVDYEEMPRYVRGFDVGVGYAPDTPQYRDQPLSKTVEFLASNLAVLATDTPGNRRYVTDGDNGVLVPDTTTALADGLERLVASPDFRALLADGARASVREYDYRRIVETDLLPIYERLLDETT